jgi:3-ketoacyl-CoA synthase
MSLLYEYLDPVDDFLGVTDSVRVVKPVLLNGIASLADVVAPNTIHLPTHIQAPLEEVIKAFTVLILTAGIVLVSLWMMYDALFGKLKDGVYITDVAVYNDFRPEWCVGSTEWSVRAQRWFNQDADDIIFCRKILARSGIGDKTHFSPGIAMFPPDISIGSARYEAEIVMFNTVDQLLKKNNIKPQDVDILVTNCSLFNPTPSLAAMVINHYKMREDILSYNLAGMGCSASPIAVDLASSMLKTHPKKDPIAIVISMENITMNIYLGKSKKTISSLIHAPKKTF